MPWTGIGSAAVGGGLALLGGALGSNAAGKAAGQQAAAIDRATGAQMRQYDQTRADNAVYRDTGAAANARLRALLGLGTDRDYVMLPDGRTVRQAAIDLYNSSRTEGNAAFDLQGANDQRALIDQFAPQIMRDAGIDPNNLPQAADSGFLLKRFGQADLDSDPVYKSGLEFGLNEGRNAINARAIQAGGYDSGATLKALTRFGNDYGSTKANESYNRFTNDQNNIYNRLTGASSGGQVATNQVNAAGMNMANNVSNLATEAGNARAAGIVGGANAWGNALGGVANAYNQNQNRQILDRILNRDGAYRTNAGGPMSYYGSSSSWDGDD